MTAWLRRLFARLTRGREGSRIRRDPFLDDPAVVEDDYQRLRRPHAQACFGAHRSIPARVGP